MAVNDSYFQPPLARDTYLAARGFLAGGAKSGGITDPVIVTLPAGTNLFRFHYPSPDYGGWWTTSYELSVIVEYFGRGAGALEEGRIAGKGILHATLAVRHDWARKCALHLGTFLVARLNAPLKAYYGEGDHAPDASHTHMQKAIRIIDHTGRQRMTRQIFLPEAENYKASFPAVDRGQSDIDLINALTACNTNRLPFET